MRTLVIILLTGLSINSFAQETFESLFQKGEKAFKDGNYELSVDYFSKCISRNRNSMEAYWYRGYAYLNQNLTQEALSDINKALDLTKSNDKNSQESLYSIRGQIYNQTRNYKNAIDDLSKAISINSKNISNFWSRALSYNALGDLNNALKDFFKCEELINKEDKINLSKLYKLIANIYENQKDFNNAIKYYSQSIKNNPENNEAYLNRGFLYIQTLSYNESFSDLTKALDIFKADNVRKAIIYTYRGNAYLNTYNYDKSIADFNQSISLNPDEYSYFNRAIAYKKLGDYQKAMNDFSKSIEYDPNNSSAYGQRAKLKEYLNDLESSLNDYNKAIELEPNWAYYYVNRGRVKQKIFGLDVALSDFEKAIKLDEVILEKSNCKHYALFFIGRQQEAIDFSLSVINKYPNADNYYDLACIYSLMNNKNLSIKYLQLALDKGFKDYVHMANDEDLNNIKYTSEFNTFLMNNKIVINLPNPISDINIQIPETNLNFNHRFALIIGNEDYSSYQVGLSKEINVDFARNDAIAIREYFIKVFGIPERNITFLTNATAAQTMQGLERLSKLASVTGGKAEIFFYYAGHGIADQETKESYIIPVDVNATNLNFAIKLQDVYNKLTEHPSQRITVFLDACFSGGARNKELLGMRAVRVRPKANAIKGNLIVFASSSDTENSQPLNSQNHGLFTYFLLKKIKETKGDVSYVELYNYVKENVALESILNKNLTQTPSIIASPEVENVWSNWKINK